MLFRFVSYHTRIIKDATCFELSISVVGMTYITRVRQIRKPVLITDMGYVRNATPYNMFWLYMCNNMQGWFSILCYIYMSNQKRYNFDVSISVVWKAYIKWIRTVRNRVVMIDIFWNMWNKCEPNATKPSIRFDYTCIDKKDPTRYTICSFYMYKQTNRFVLFFIIHIK